MVHGPVRKDCAPVNEPAGDRAEYSGIIRTDPVIAHHKVHTGRYAHRAVVAQILVLRGDVWFLDLLPVHVHDALSYFHALSGQRYDALDERLGPVQGIP